MIDDIDVAGPFEPLAESAPLAWAAAPHLCPGDPQAADSCMWYHRVWQYLRLLGIMSTIRTNTDFLVQQLQALATSGDSPRVLISGTADYGMLAHVKYAYGVHDLHVTVADRCESSLFLNRWYADRCGVALATVRGDILDYSTDHPFDVICTHNLVGRFDSGSRRRLVAQWRHLLRPGGLLVTTQRVHPTGRPHRSAYSAYTPEQARELGARVAAAAAAYAWPLGADPHDLGLAVYEYAIRKGSYAIRTTGEVTDLFEAEGFDIEHVDEGGGEAERERDRPGTNVGRDSYRMRLVAKKR